MNTGNSTETLAKRLPLAELKGVSDGVVVPQGYRAVLLANNEPVGVLGPGPQSLADLSENVTKYRKDRNHQAVLVFDGEFTLILSRPLAADASAWVAVRVRIDAPERFVQSLLLTRPKALSLDGLRSLLEPELRPLLLEAGLALESTQVAIDKQFTKKGMRVISISPGAPPLPENADKARRRFEERLARELFRAESKAARAAMLRQIREKELMAEQAIDDLETALREDREDHETARMQFQAKLAELQAYELEMLRLDHEGELARQRLGAELDRERAENALDMEEAREAVNLRESVMRRLVLEGDDHRPMPPNIPGAEVKVCPSCNMANQPRHKFCIYCGTKLKA